MSSEERGGFEVVRDGEVVRKVSRDPGVLAIAAFHHLYAERILDSGRNEDDTVWLTAEPVAGQPLSEILRVQGPLPLRRFLPLYERVCEAIAAAHEAGLAHGALDAGSIRVVSRRGQLLPKVMDFRGGDPADDRAALVRLAREALGDPEALPEPPASAGDLPEALREAAGLGEDPELTAVPSDVWERTVLYAPQPIAEAAAAMEGAEDPLVAVWKVVRTSARWVGLCALAGRDRGTAPSEAELTLRRKLRLFGLSSPEWVELARETLRPFAARADAHPLPELVGLFFDESGADRRSPFDDVLEENADSQQAELPDASVALASLAPRVASLLEQLSFFADYPLAVPRGERAERWMGVRRQPRPPLPLELAAPVLTDREGAPILPLAPFVHAAPLLPGGPAELFLLEGNGRRGARLVALPGALEREDGGVWGTLDEAEEPAETSGPALERSPFPSLAPFTGDEASFFFGREAEILRCTNRLKTRPLLAVIGHAGAGKRSLVQAGLVPALPEEWRAVVIRPGASPVEALAARLEDQGIDADIRDPEAFGATLRAEAGSGILVLVVVNLEEIFTVCHDEVERERFAALLGAAARDVADPVRVVVTLRDDFYLRADALPGLRERLTFEILRAPVEKDMARLLVQATRRAGYELEDAALAEEMAAAATGTPAPLLSLSFAARRMWQERRGRILTRKALEEAGGVAGAVERWAEEIYAGLTPAERDAARGMLRRPGAVAGDVSRFVEVGLVVESDGVARLVHDALPAVWPRLAAWRREDAEEPPLVHDLREAAGRWERQERASDLLWRGDAAAELRRHRQRAPLSLGDPADAFTRASLAAASGEKRRRWLAAGVAAVLVGAGGFTVAQRPGVEASSLVTDRQRILEDTVTHAYLSEGRRLALTGSPTTGLVYLAAAYERGARGPAVELALSRALQATSAAVAEMRHGDVVTGVSFAPDGKRLVTSSWDATARLWDASTGALLLILAHDQPVYAAAFSPDGLTLATVGTDGKARLYDTRTGALRQTLAGHEDRLRIVLFSPDGARLVTGGADAARIWDAATGKLQATLVGHKRGVTAAQLTRDGARIVTGGGDGSVHLWDAATGKMLQTFAGHEDAINAVDVSADGTLVVTASDDGSARIFDTKTGRLRTKLDHRAEVVQAQFAPAGDRIVTASADKTAKVWDGRAGRLLFVISGHEGAVTRALFSPDGSRIATASEDRTVQLWDTETGRRVARLTGHAGRVSALAWEASGAHLASGGHDGTAIIWSGDPEPPAAALRGHSSALTWAAFSPDGARAVTSGTDRVAKVWDVAAVRELATLTGHQDVVLRASFSRDGKRIVTASLDKTARLWDAQSGQQAGVLGGHTGPVLDATFSPDGTRVATASWDRTAALWDAQTGVQIKLLSGFRDKVYDVTFSPDGTRLLAASDGPVRVYDARSGAELDPFPAKLQIIRFDPAGRRIAGVGLDQTIKLWDFTGRTLFAELEGHVGEVEDVEFSPDGKLIASAGADGTAKVWDAETGDLVLSFDQHDQRVTSASFSPDGRSLLTSSADGAALIWPLPSFPLDPVRIRALVRCRVPYRLDEGRLMRVPTDREACRDSYRDRER